MQSVSVSSSRSWACPVQTETMGCARSIGLTGLDSAHRHRFGFQGSGGVAVEGTARPMREAWIEALLAVLRRKLPPCAKDPGVPGLGPGFKTVPAKGSPVVPGSFTLVHTAG